MESGRTNKLSKCIVDWENVTRVACNNCANRARNVRPVARGVQTGAIAPPSPTPPPPLDARSAWQAMSIVHLIVYCSAMYMYTYQRDLPCMYIVHLYMP